MVEPASTNFRIRMLSEKLSRFLKGLGSKRFYFTRFIFKETFFVN